MRACADAVGMVALQFGDACGMRLVGAMCECDEGGVDGTRGLCCASLEMWYLRGRCRDLWYVVSMVSCLADC